MAAFNLLLWHRVFSYDVPAPQVPAYVVPTSAAQAASAPESVGLPVRITIPRIAVDAAIEQVALAADGSMDVPKDPLDTAWYKLGPRPGDVGSAAIAGHVVWWGGTTGVFANLDQLEPGDKIDVQDETGAVTTFVVRKSRTYDAAANATEVFTSDDGKAHLNLITCSGAWNKRAKQYAKRLVVFADKETD